MWKSNVKTYKSSETDLREFKYIVKVMLKSENLSMDKEKWGGGGKLRREDLNPFSAAPVSTSIISFGWNGGESESLKNGTFNALSLIASKVGYQ